MELALAHRVGSAVEQAYARSDLLEKRRDHPMDQWAVFAPQRRPMSCKTASLSAVRRGPADNHRRARAIEAGT